MSGGRFEHRQYILSEMADEIERVISLCGRTDVGEHGGLVGYDLSGASVYRLREAAAALRQARAMVDAIDWLLSGDDSEDTFAERWAREVIGPRRDIGYEWESARDMLARKGLVFSGPQAAAAALLVSERHARNLNKVVEQAEINRRLSEEERAEAAKPRRARRR